MRIAAFSALLVTMILTLPLAALAADGYNPKTERVSEMNRISPKQNPKFDGAQDVLGRRVLDRKSKVVGSIEDIVLNKNGSIAFLDVKFDRIQLPRAVFVNYTGFNLQPVTNGYAMTFDANEIETVYPQMLADIETAAGEEDTLSLRKLQGVSVKTTTGRPVGKVEDVLFGGNGERAEGLYVAMTAGTLRGRSVAIPFNEANTSKIATAREVIISDEVAAMMETIAKN